MGAEVFLLQQCLLPSPPRDLQQKAAHHIRDQQLPMVLGKCRMVEPFARDVQGQKTLEQWDVLGLLAELPLATYREEYNQYARFQQVLQRY